MKNKKNQSQLIDLIKEKNSNLVDFLMLDVEIDKNNPFITEEKVRAQLNQLVSQDEVNERFLHGLDLAKEDLSSHLSIVEFEAINQELQTAVDKVIAMMQERASTQEDSIDKLAQTPDSLQELLGISDNTLNQFFRSGHRYYEGSRFTQASDLCFAINILNPFKYNGWLALGMAEKERHRFREALQAFSMATLIDITSVYPHIHSAICYRALKAEDDVKKSLDLALKTLEEHPTPDAQKIKEYIANFNQQYG